MSIPIAGGAVLIIALGLLYVHNREKVLEQNEGQISQDELEPELQRSCDTTLMNNPRSDLHVDSISNSLQANYAGVDPTRHKVHSKNTKDAGGDSMYRTSLGHIITDLKPTTTSQDPKLKFIHQDGELKTKHRSHDKGIEWPF